MKNTSKTNKQNKVVASNKEALDQVKKDIRTTVKRMSRPKGSYSEIAELNKVLTKQLNTYSRLNVKKVPTVKVKVSI